MVTVRTTSRDSTCRSWHNAMLRASLLLLLSWTILFEPVTAQPENRRLGVGVVVGGFSGLSAKYYFGLQKGVRAADIHLSLDIGSDFSIMSHVLFERPIAGSPLTFVAGAGATVENEKSDTRWGGSGTIGVLFVKHRFDVFMQAFPQVIFSPEIDPRLRWSVGIRYFF
jgi:hypothetical protein